MRRSTVVPVNFSLTFFMKMNTYPKSQVIDLLLDFDADKDREADDTVVLSGQTWSARPRSFRFFANITKIGGIFASEIKFGTNLQ